MRPWEFSMRMIALCSLTLAVAFGIDADTGAHAAWCAQYFNGGTNCGFSTMAQCLESVRGVGGQCGNDGSGVSVERSSREANPRREPRRKPVATARRPQPAPAREAAVPAPEATAPPKPVSPQ